MAKISFSEKIKSLFSGKKESEEFYEELTDSLIEGDIGAKTAFEISDILEQNCKKNHISGEQAITLELKKILLEYVKSLDLEPWRWKNH